jgi:hypothetical protein
VSDRQGCHPSQGNNACPPVHCSSHQEAAVALRYLSVCVHSSAANQGPLPQQHSPQLRVPVAAGHGLFHAFVCTRMMLPASATPVSRCPPITGRGPTPDTPRSAHCVWPHTPPPHTQRDTLGPHGSPQLSFERIRREGSGGAAGWPCGAPPSPTDFQQRDFLGSSSFMSALRLIKSQHVLVVLPVPTRCKLTLAALLLSPLFPFFFTRTRNTPPSSLDAGHLVARLVWAFGASRLPSGYCGRPTPPRCR